MAIGTGAIGLIEVKDYLGLLSSTASLQDCIDTANDYAFNPTYGVPPCTSLAEFRGYDNTLSHNDSLGFHASTAATACAAIPTPYWTDNVVLGSATFIANNQTGTSPASQGYYSDGLAVRFWNSTSKTFTSTASC